MGVLSKFGVGCECALHASSLKRARWRTREINTTNMPPPGSVREAGANAPLSAALTVPPAPAADVAKRPRDPEAGPAALPKKVPKQRAAYGQSDGVYWHKQKGKWRGEVYDLSQHYLNGRAKLLHTACFTDRAACAAARAALLAATRAKNAARLAAMAAADPTTRGLLVAAGESTLISRRRGGAGARRPLWISKTA